MSRLKTSVAFSASLTVSLKLASSGLSMLSPALPGALLTPAAPMGCLTRLKAELSRGVVVLGRFGTAPKLTILDIEGCWVSLVCECVLPRELKFSCCKVFVSLMASTISDKIAKMEGSPIASPIPRVSLSHNELTFAKLMPVRLLSSECILASRFLAAAPA